MRVITGYFEHYPQQTSSHPTSTQHRDKPHRSLLLGFYHQFWRKMTQVLSGSSTPCVRQVCGHRGQQYWRVHDPVTNRDGIFASEEEVRIWLEKRYYR